MTMYEAIAADRGRHGKVLHLFGDSIMGGWALGTFTPPETHPLYRFRSPESMIRELFTANGILDTVVHHPFAIIGGVPLGTTTGYDVWPERIRDPLTRGVIRSGDVVVLEDAGPHGDEPAWREDALLELRAAATDRHDVTCVMVNTPDYPPCPLNSQWDAVQADGRTMNEITQAVALSDHSWPGQTLFLDWNTENDARRASALAGDGVDLFHPDGIHPNVWGQMLLVKLILRSAGYGHLITNAQPLIDLAVSVGPHEAMPCPSAARCGQYAHWTLLE